MSDASGLVGLSTRQQCWHYLLRGALQPSPACNMAESTCSLLFGFVLAEGPDNLNRRSRLQSAGAYFQHAVRHASCACYKRAHRLQRTQAIAWLRSVDEGWWHARGHVIVHVVMSLLALPGKRCRVQPLPEVSKVQETLRHNMTLWLHLACCRLRHASCWRWQPHSNLVSRLRPYVFVCSQACTLWCQLRLERWMHARLLAGSV